jgi:hypothetical protein
MRTGHRIMITSDPETGTGRAARIVKKSFANHRLVQSGEGDE